MVYWLLIYDSEEQINLVFGQGKNQIFWDIRKCQPKRVVVF